jgi:YidC/Oxa1 family membrane protein insertase
MRIKTAVTAGVILFCGACGWLILDAVSAHRQGLNDSVVSLAAVENQPSGEMTAEVPMPAQAQEGVESKPEEPKQKINYPVLNAANSTEQTVRLGALYPELKRTNDPGNYKFMVVLTSKGAAVERVILSEFKSRTQPGSAEAISAESEGGKVISPLTLLAPLGEDRKIYSLANTSLYVAPAEAEDFGTKSFPLDKLNWKLAETDSRTMAKFEAVLFEEGQDPAKGEGTLRLVKTYRIEAGSYELLTDVSVENLSGRAMKVQMQFQGPGGILREDLRQDMRKVVAAYKNTDVTTHLMRFADVHAAAREAVHPSQGIGATLRKLFGSKATPKEKLQLTPEKPAPFVWAALTNKYFAAIVRPVTEEPGTSVLEFGTAKYYGAIDAKNADKESAGLVAFVLNTSAAKPLTLAAAGQEGAAAQLTLGTYLGPKDREVFEAHPVYKALGYFHTIDFQACCCPSSMIAPLAFGIIWLMKSMYTLMGPWGNYGVVIMVLVLVVRLILHPVTKKSQVSMMKMQKLGPKMQEIQKKYANNRAEMNKQVMQLYKEGGATPVMGMLPMFLQMPIWIALWTAVYTSIDLRGAGFLPFWITDLSVPDHLFRIPFAQALQQIPLLGSIVPEYFNLLPILMGVVMYFQQKLMPQSTAAATNPQMAQQQKMMMIMMPLLFPVMLYNGPSGVNLYIMASIGGGVIEQKVIRKHIQQRQEEEEQGKVPVTAKTGGKLKKKKPKPFFKG